jgi:hypothetical protein
MRDVGQETPVEPPPGVVKTKAELLADTRGQDVAFEPTAFRYGSKLRAQDIQEVPVEKESVAVYPLGSFDGTFDPGPKPSPADGPDLGPVTVPEKIERDFFGVLDLVPQVKDPTKEIGTQAHIVLYEQEAICLTPLCFLQSLGHRPVVAFLAPIGIRPTEQPPLGNSESAHFAVILIASIVVDDDVDLSIPALPNKVLQKIRKRTRTIVGRYGDVYVANGSKAFFRVCGSRGSFQNSG